MGISFGSINTGLPKDIVKQIIKAEKIPLVKMNSRKSKIKDREKLVDNLIDLLKSVDKNLAQNANARSLRELKVDTNNDFVGVTIDKNIAHTGNYQLEVSQLAQKSSAMSSGFESKDDSYIGVGFIQYFLPDGESRELYVDSENSSLTGVAKLINKDADNGMRATVVNDGKGTDAPWRLLISLDETGDGKKADFPYFYFIDGEDDLYLEFERAAQDAKVKLDGFEIEVPGNKLQGIIPGVTVDLKKAKPGEEFSVNIGEDKEAVSGKINDIVDTINGVLAFIKEQNTLDQSSDTSRTLGGDLILQTLETRIRATIFKDIETKKGVMRIGDLGITFQRSGLLELNQKKFDAALANGYGSASEVLTGFYVDGGKSKGFIDNMRDTLKTVLRRPGGLLQTRKASLKTKINQIDRRIEQKQNLIDQKEKNLKNKFARLEETMSRIKSQGAGIAALGAQAQNPVQQLG